MKHSAMSSAHTASNNNVLSGSVHTCVQNNNTTKPLDASSRQRLLVSPLVMGEKYLGTASGELARYGRKILKYDTASPVE